MNEEVAALRARLAALTRLRDTQIERWIALACADSNPVGWTDRFVKEAIAALETHPGSPEAKARARQEMKDIHRCILVGVAKRRSMLRSAAPATPQDYARTNAARRQSRLQA